MIKYIAILLLLSSCVTQRKCEEKFGECGRVHNYHTIEYRDTTFYLKGESITDTLEICDVEYIHWKDSTGKLTADFKKLTNNKYSVEINSKPDTVYLPEFITKITKAETKYVNRDKIPFWIWLIMAGLSVCLLASLFRR